MSSVRIQETDVTGETLQTYSLSTTKDSSRIDIIPSSDEFQKRSTATASTQSFINTHVAPLFLPHGYPHSVTSDYTSYQIYDSLQAFASAIAHLLSSRAVLQSLGMDSTESGSSTATYATLLSVARSTISNVSQIFFADYMSSRINSEVKYYRFLADILNDVGFFLEMVSPSLPEYLKIPILCSSSALRAMCGVAGGASKAILSTHFAVDGNIGELNAKDGSQEVLINLLGMWAGGVVVSKVEGFWATWCWMIMLLTLHLWFNWLAVTSVRLRGLNLGRAGMVFGTLIKDEKCDSIENIGRREKVFDKPGAIRDNNGKIVLTGRIGVRTKELTRLMGGRRQQTSGSETIEGNGIKILLETFADEPYLMWYAPAERKAVILLKESASRDDQLRAWCHAVRVAHTIGGQSSDQAEVLRLITKTLLINNDAWPHFRGRIEDAGWDLSATVLESNPGIRLKLSTG